MLTEEVRLEMQGEISFERALEIYNSGWWRGMEPREVASIQLQQRRVCVVWGEFTDIVQEALGRGVFSHEFIDGERLLAELNGMSPAATVEESIEKLIEIRGGSENIVVIDV